MKRIVICTLLFCMAFAVAKAQNKAEIKFDKTTIDLGKFSEKEPVRTAVFTFTNTGSAPLVIHNAVASCGCTVPQYTKTPIKPGEKGTIKVTYNGEGKFLGHFKKSITINSNAETSLLRIYVEGIMTE